ncbi:MAG TPA: MFS transporter [Methylomirabilota bacterium]|nr:MFS transporter [Methylomirabilota bacterium]
MSNRVFTPTLVACLAITASIHTASYLLATTLPLHLVALGGSKAQVGMLFSVMQLVSMALRPLVGGWIDRYGFKPVIVPGVFALLVTSLAFHLAAAPTAIIALMAGLGVSHGLISTSVGVLAAQTAAPEHRGEALSVYYVATSVAFAVGPPIGLGLYGAGGMRINFLVVTGFAMLIGLLAWRMAGSGAGGRVRSEFRWYSRKALPMACTLILTNLGYSSIYAFLPLYAMANGMDGNLGWFYALFSVCIISGRLSLRRVSDRLGRVWVLVPTMAILSIAFFVLALPPAVPTLAAAAVLLGAAVAVLYPTLLALLVDRTPEAERGSAIGTLAASFDLGVVVGSLLVGLTVDRASYAAGFSLGGVGALLGLGCFTLMERRGTRDAVLPRPSTGV